MKQVFHIRSTRDGKDDPAEPVKENDFIRGRRIISSLRNARI